MELVEKHFNAVTFGNELKPDALFNYQLDSSIKTKKINVNDSELELPVVNDAGDSLDFSRADAMADKMCIRDSGWYAWRSGHRDHGKRGNACGQY